MRFITRIFPLALLLLISCLPVEETKVKYWLTVLHNNDGESHLLHAPGQEDFGGVSRFATLASKLKKEAEKGRDRGTKQLVVLLSSGDNFLAGPQFQASLVKGVPYYDSIAMNQIGYNAICLGNHDFDFGPDILANFIAGFDSQVRFLSANLDFRQEPLLNEEVEKHRIAKSLVVRQKWTAIGIVGATTPRLPLISSPRNVSIDPDVRGAIQEQVDLLQERGVKIIILISHLQNIQEDMTLARMLKGVDIMIAGGGDELLANPEDLLIPGDEKKIFGPYPILTEDSDGKEVPVITTSGNYRYIGRFLAAFDQEGNLIRWNKSKSGPVRVAGGSAPDAVPPDPKLQTEVTGPLKASISQMASNLIATSEVSLNGTRKVLRTTESNEGNLIADALLSEAKRNCAVFAAPTPTVAILNAGGMRNDSVIPPGSITELITFDMLPFPNFISIVPSVSPAQFKEILENAVSKVESADGRFAQISGFRFIWDALGTAQELDANFNVLTAGTRIREAVLSDGTQMISNGAVVPGAPSLNVATIDFLARGGDQYPFREIPFVTLGITYQQALSSYIKGNLSGLITAVDYPENGEGRISSRFLPIGEASCSMPLLFQFETGWYLKQ
jgi:5'-nucleotidase / UDP-sugar diphosphatase